MLKLERLLDLEVEGLILLGIMLSKTKVASNILQEELNHALRLTLGTLFQELSQQELLTLMVPSSDLPAKRVQRPPPVVPLADLEDT